MRRHIALFLVALSSLSSLLQPSCGVRQDKKSKAVTTLLNSKWPQGPVALEIAEYLAEEDQNYFWMYVNQISEMNPSFDTYTKARDQYTEALKVAGSLLSSPRLRVLKFSLSLHTHSVLVEMFQQMGRERGVGGVAGCGAVVEVGQQLLCDGDDISEAINKINGPSPLETYDVDHHYPGSANNSITVILYGELRSREFGVRHRQLSQLAEQGKVDYVLRWFVKNRGTRRVRLSGYGVELQLKSTEYKSQDDSHPERQGEGEGGSESEESQEDENDPANVVDGFNFGRLRNLFPDLRKSLEQFKSHLLEQDTELAPLKVWQFQELSLQASESIMAVPTHEALSHFINIAHNFPMQAHNLVRIAVSPQLKEEIKYNQELFSSVLNVHPTDCALFVNGMFFDMDAVDVISLLQYMKQEVTTMEGLHNLDLSKSRVTSLLNLDISHSLQSAVGMYGMGASSTQDFALDIRDSGVMWVNDLENDYQYKRWPTSYMDLLRPSYPGMLKSIRRNLYNVIIVFDPVAVASRSLIKRLDSFVRQTMPIRIGFAMKLNSDVKVTGLQDPGIAVLCVYNYMAQEKGAREAFGFLTSLYNSIGDGELHVDDVKKRLKTVGSYGVDVEDVLGEDSDYDYGRKLTAEFVSKTGTQTFPQVLVNGVPLPEEDLTLDQFEESLLTEIMHHTGRMQKAVFRGELTDLDDAVDYLMGQSNVMPRLNQRILNSEAGQYLDLTGKASPAGFDPSKISQLMSLSNPDMTATAIKNLRYLRPKSSSKEDKKKKKVTMESTIWVVGDLACPRTRQILKASLEYMKSSSGVRITFLPNVDGNKATMEESSLNKVVVAALNVLPEDRALKYVLDILENDGCHQRKDCNIIPELVPALNKQDWLLKLSRVYVNRVLGFKKAGEAGLVYNGRVLGPLNDMETFYQEDFLLLERFGNMIYGDKIKSALYPPPQESDNDVVDDGTDEIEDTPVSADSLMKIISLLSSRPMTRTRFNLPSDVREHHSVVKISSGKSTSLSIVAIVDPVSRAGQKMGSLLQLLSQVFDCDIKLYLNSVEKNSDMPLKSFYRFVGEPELQFNDNTGELLPGPMARFTQLPQSSLLTLSLQVPGNWLVESVSSVYDLDNIRLADVEKLVHSEFELEYLLLEGHCWDVASSSPPRGLQVTLGTSRNPTMVDTIVMANLGYFQLKANPGAWTLRLRQGRSADIYDIVGVENADTPANSTDIKVLISSLRAHVLKMKVAKKPGKQGVDLLGEDDDKQGGGIWNSITSSFTGGETGDGSQETINIFSVASGHLYERFLRIMMLSLLKHTTTPVKFWFLKNYLSPSLKDILPYMAKEYKFDYELVEYKWPRWLHQQTEKQRIIWGYKILFLDVLFPLDVKKIIFVDADQIVRADMKELVDLDLAGAPYGYTPFCESRTEMDGFRFWKQGYWKNHLQGRRYHISALYVVDLKRFRRIAAGDRLRGQYQALSQDPNSLSNLDQDLPNNMIHQVAIKSLPQEWLWCETWCDDTSKTTAKTIDLCNNPMTKEAKLTAAVRIVPEWTSYDEEIKRLQQRILRGEFSSDSDDGGTEDGHHADNTVKESNTAEDVHTEL